MDNQILSPLQEAKSTQNIVLKKQNLEQRLREQLLEVQELLLEHLLEVQKLLLEHLQETQEEDNRDQRYSRFQLESRLQRHKRSLERLEGHLKIFPEFKNKSQEAFGNGLNQSPIEAPQETPREPLYQIPDDEQGETTKEVPNQFSGNEQREEPEIEQQEPSVEGLNQAPVIEQPEIEQQETPVIEQPESSSSELDQSSQNEPLRTSEEVLDPTPAIEEPETPWEDPYQVPTGKLQNTPEPELDQTSEQELQEIPSVSSTEDVNHAREEWANTQTAEHTARFIAQGVANAISHLEQKGVVRLLAQDLMQDLLKIRFEADQALYKAQENERETRERFLRMVNGQIKQEKGSLSIADEKGEWDDEWEATMRRPAVHP